MGDLNTQDTKTKAPYVIKYDIKADDLNILDITYHQ